MKYTLLLLVAYLLGCVSVLVSLQARDARIIEEEWRSVRRELADDVLLAKMQGQEVRAREQHFRDASPAIVLALNKTN